MKHRKKDARREKMKLVGRTNVPRYEQSTGTMVGRLAHLFGLRPRPRREGGEGSPRRRRLRRRRVCAFFIGMCVLRLSARPTLTHLPSQ